MLDEEFMEDCVEECPKAFLGRDLKVAERQLSLGGFRPDLICIDGHITWIVEIQQRALDRTHLYKCLEYRDLLRARGVSEIRVTVLCNTIDEKYLPLARTHEVEILAIEKDKFIDLATKWCPRSVAKLIKRKAGPTQEQKPRLITKYHFRPLGWTEHVSVLDIISHIYRECGRNNLSLGDLRNEKYWSIMYEIKNLMCRDWQATFSDIVDPKYWNIDSILAKPAGWQPDFLEGVKRIRKPEIEITAFITSKDNLSIVWCPRGARGRRGIYLTGDWASWPGEDSYGWSRPANELVFIREISRLRPGYFRGRADPELCNWEVLDELFICLVRAAYNWLCEVLAQTVHVEKITDFEFDLEDPSVNDFIEKSGESRLYAAKRVTRWSIYNLEGRRIEIERKWIEGFEKQYGISLKRMIDGYNTCLTRGRNRVPHRRAKYVADELQKEGIQVTQGQVDEIFTRLRQHHSHYVESFDKAI